MDADIPEMGVTFASRNTAWRDAMAEDVRQLLEAFLEHELMNEAAEYVGRGRTHGDASSEDLAARWVLAFRKWSRDPAGEDRRELDDLWAELRLRGIETPADQVAAEIDELAKRAAAEAERSGAPVFRRKFSAFLEERDDLN